MKQQSFIRTHGESVATFSPCRTWRYTLSRVWGPDYPVCMFVGLNPSTADEIHNDPTVRRCIGFARDWGYGGLLMLNIFAFRATDPRCMRATHDPVGPMNDFYLVSCAERAALVVAAWGTHGNHENRHQSILKLFQEHGITLRCLKVTKNGMPGHPLYLPRHLTTVPYETKPC